MKKIHILLLATISLAVACIKEPILSETKKLSLNLPNQPGAYYETSFDSSINHKAQLGRVLFYEKQLSLNNTISCGSCHKQAFAFADNQRFSKGLENKQTSRNSPPLQDFSNLNMFIDNAEGTPINPIDFVPGIGGNEFFWDGRQNNLKDLILKPVANHVEMGITDVNMLIPKLTKLPYYKNLFLKAYQSEEITLDKISDAVATFIQAMNTNNSKFNRVLFGAAAVLNQETFTAVEQNGFDLFFGKYPCGQCHQINVGSYFSSGFMNIGLDDTPKDRGRAVIDNNSFNEGAFKTPNLKNVALTAPYMHDGRFNTLEEVIEHYSTGIKMNPALHPTLRDENDYNSPRKMNITNEDKRALIAFLNTLTDPVFVTDPKFSDPFIIE
jgi:cytochrome c peroxidase